MKELTKENHKTFGWHNFSGELLLFHAQLKQFLQEPAKELERMKKEAVAMKHFIESVIDTPEEALNGSVDNK